MERLNWNSILQNTPDLTEEDKSALDSYFRCFTKPDIRDGVMFCINCGKEFNTLKQAIGIGEALAWGLVHGEAFCTGCKYPYRGRHYDIGPIQSLPWYLPYHPDEVGVLSTKTKENAGG